MLMNDIGGFLETMSVFGYPENKIWYEERICGSKNRGFTQIFNCH